MSLITNVEPACAEFSKVSAHCYLHIDVDFSMMFDLSMSLLVGFRLSYMVLSL